MIHIVRCGIGNIQSVINAFEAVGVAAVVADRPQALDDASHIILPGVGSFHHAAAALREGGWTDKVVELATVRQRPLLGICLGMQLLADRGEEHGTSPGLGLIPGVVRMIPRTTPDLRLPHVGWNELVITGECPLTEDIGSDRDCYFVHSYQFQPVSPAHCVAVTDYGGPVTAMVMRDNVFGCQFHPEKSGAVGLRILSNFAKL